MIDADPLPARWHCLQHVPFEGPAHFATWARQRGYRLTRTELWVGARFPASDQYDGLIILGGPMNVGEDSRYSWLAPEKQFIKRSVSDGKLILGVCLGAQLLAESLGGSVTAMVDREIGWFPVSFTPDGRESGLFRQFPDEFMAFHWHGDCLSIPPKAVHAARSEACEGQAFVYKDRVVGLQFHLESDDASIAALIGHCGDELGCGPYVQAPRSIGEESAAHLPAAHGLLEKLLDTLCQSAG